LIIVGIIKKAIESHFTLFTLHWALAKGPYFWYNIKIIFLKNKNRVGRNPIFIEVSKLESIDIDDEEDFLIAEAIFNFTKVAKKIRL